MSIFESVSRPTHSSLMNKTKSDLAFFVLQIMEFNEQDRQDAERYRFVKRHYRRMASPKMDGIHTWHFRAMRLEGNTIDEAVDDAIKRQKDRG